MPTLTAIIPLQKPIVGNDVNNWGDQLNAGLDKIDSLGALNVITTSTNLTAVITVSAIQVILATGGAAGITVTLPTPVGNRGKAFAVVKTDLAVGTVTVTPATGLIAGLANFVLVNLNQNMVAVSDGTNYFIFSNN